MRTQCSMPNCDAAPRHNQRYCPECHSKYMKAWRAKRKREQEKLAARVVQMRAQLVEKNRLIEELKVG
jgi:hypothetical protein